MNPAELQAQWLAHNDPSVSITPPVSRTPEQVDASLKAHAKLSLIRANTKYPKASSDNRRALITSTDPTMYNYGK